MPSHSGGAIINRNNKFRRGGLICQKKKRWNALARMHHVREGKHGAASTKQAIAIGLSKARRAGVKLQAPRNGASAQTKKQAERDSEKGQSYSGRKPSAKRSRATSNALKKEGHSAASHRALSRQAHAAAKKRSSSARHDSAIKASRTRRKTA